MTIQLSDLKKGFNIRSGSEVPDVDFFPTGILGIDYITGGGLPFGLYTELVGNTNLGKSTLCLHMARKMLRDYPEAEALYFDAEGRIRSADLERAFQGDFIQYADRFHLSDESLIQHIFNTIDAAVELDFEGIIIIDSLASLITQEELANVKTKDIEAKAPGSPMSIALGRLAKLFSRQIRQRKIVGVMVNQTRAKLNPYMTSVPRPGGEAMKFAVAHSLILKGSNKPDKDITTLEGEPLSNGEIYTEKASYAPARLYCDYAISTTGVEPIYSLYKLLVEGELKDKVLTTEGNKYYLPEEAKADLNLTDEQLVLQMPGKKGKAAKKDVYTFLANPENEAIVNWLYNWVVAKFTTKGRQDAKYSSRQNQPS